MSDLASFEAFYRAHFHGVYRYVRTQIGGDEVDDACSVVFTVAHRRFDELRGLDDIRCRAWLLRAARFQCLHRHRSRFRRLRALARLSVPEETDLSVDEFLLGNGDEATRERVRSVLCGLVPEQQELLALDMDGRATGREVAARLGITEGAARVRVLRARRAFAAAYEGRYGHPFRQERGPDD